MKKLILIIMTLATFGLAATNANTYTVSTGASKLIKYPKIIKNIAVGSPEIADVILISKEEILLQGKKPGTTSLTIWDTHGSTEYTLTIIKGSSNLYFKAYRLQNLSLTQTFIEDPSAQNIKVISKPISETIKDLQTIVATYINPDNFSVSTWTNSILVVGTEKEHQAIADMLSMIDRKEKQVVFQVEVYEMVTDTNFGHELALSYGKDNSLDPDHQYTSSSGAYGKDAGLSYTLNTETYTAAGNLAEAISTTLKHYQSEGKAKLLAKPKLLTLNNQFAYILSGDKIPVESKDKEGNMTVTYFPIGVILSVVPRVNDNDTIQCWLTTEVSGISKSIKSAGNNPIISTRATTNEVRLKNKEILVLGGLLHDTESVITHKIPILGDALGWIPFVGGFFKNESNETKSSELIITIRPEIIFEEQ